MHVVRIIEGRRGLVMARTKEQNWKVGDTVELLIAGGVRRALVIEDRGNLGVGGTRIVLVETPGALSEPDTWEIPASAIVSRVPRSRRPRWKIGDKVLVRFAYSVFTVRVIEDRGPLGVGGEQILRVEMRGPNGEPDQWETRASNVISRVPPRARVAARRLAALGGKFPGARAAPRRRFARRA